MKSEVQLPSQEAQPDLGVELLGTVERREAQDGSAISTMEVLYIYIY